MSEIARDAGYIATELLMEIYDNGHQPFSVNAEILERAILAERRAATERAANVVGEFRNRSKVSLHLGELTAQEFRTVCAVLDLVAYRIRNQEQKP